MNTQQRHEYRSGLAKQVLLLLAMLWGTPVVAQVTAPDVVGHFVIPTVTIPSNLAKSTAQPEAPYPVLLSKLLKANDQQLLAFADGAGQSSLADNSPASDAFVPSQLAPTLPNAVSQPGNASAVHSIFKGFTNLLERNFSMPGYNPPPSVPIPRSAPPAPLDPVFPSSEFLGLNSQAPMGVNDANYAQYPLEQYLWQHVPI